MLEKAGKEWDNKSIIGIGEGEIEKFLDGDHGRKPGQTINLFRTVFGNGWYAGKVWSGKRELNPRLRPWQGRTLPLSYSRSAKSLFYLL